MCLFIQGIISCPSNYEATPSCDVSTYNSKCTSFQAGGYAATMYFKFMSDELGARVDGVLDARNECDNEAEGKYSPSI